MTASLPIPHPEISAEGAPYRLAGRWLRLGQLAWASMFALCLALWLLGAYEWYDNNRRSCADPVNATWPAEVCQPFKDATVRLGLGPTGYAAFTASLYLLAGLPHFVLSFSFVRRRTDSARVLMFAILWAALGATGKWMNPLPAWAAGFNAGGAVDLNWPANLILFFWGGLGPLLICAFPDGRFQPRWTRWACLIWLPLSFGANLLKDTPFNYGNWPDPANQVINLAVIGTVLFSLVYRYRRMASPTQRQQIKWFVAGLSLVGILYIADFSVWQVYPWLTGGAELIGAGMPSVLWELIQGSLWSAAEIFLAICIAFSVFRHRLWDVDILLNRGLVYGCLTVAVVILYAAIVGVLSALLQSAGSLAGSILAAGLVAVAAQPLRDRLQRWVNRLMFGDRDDPVTVLSRLGQRLEGPLMPNAILPGLVETVAQTLKLPYAAIRLDGEPAAVYGQPEGDLVSFPLVYQGDSIGQFSVAPRAPGEAFSGMDRHLLENIARQAGAAAHAVLMAQELQRARQRLVNALEDERRRLRRDLHDGLGPSLASQGLKLAAVRQMLDGQPEPAVALLDEVMAQTRATVEDVRRLVYGLRPPALDERGLAAAIRDHAAPADGAPIRIEVGELPAGLSPLPAAVEVAAYRIALEALTNSLRHAGASRCAVQFAPDKLGQAEALRMEIVDDGRGLQTGARMGIGLRSMHERAEELGGQLAIDANQPSGTRITVRLPVAAPA